MLTSPRFRKVLVSNQTRWLLLGIFALATRVSAALLLPNGEQDAYTYAETIARMHAQLRGGHFQIANLFDFWLPLYSFAGAVANFAVGNALLTGKLLSALGGAASCLLVFSITQEITKSVRLAWIAFALIVTSPLHLFYSAASMTDVPHACFVLAAVRAAMARRWLLAAILAAAAEGMRVEAWLFIGLLPLLEFRRERRVSFLPIIALLTPVLACLAISRAQTGDLLALFHHRTENVAAFLHAQPWRRVFHLADMERDLTYFLLGANTVVFAGALAAAGLILRDLRKPRPLQEFEIRVVLSVFFSLLGFLVFAYITKAQPVIWIRYGLIFFALGTPLFAWVMQVLWRKLCVSWQRGLITSVVVVLCAFETFRQISVIVPAVADDRAHRKIASEIRARCDVDGSAARCFSDDAAVRVLSGLGAARFLRTPLVPSANAQDASSFEQFLHADGVRYLVFMKTENSLPVQLFPELGSATTDPSRGITETFELLRREATPFGPDLLLYRVR